MTADRRQLQDNEAVESQMLDQVLDRYDGHVFVSLPTAPAALETQPEGDRLDDAFWLPRRSAKALPAAFRPRRHLCSALLLALAACDRRRELSGPCGARFTDLAVGGPLPRILAVGSRFCSTDDDQWPLCANTGRSQAARRAGQFDPEREFDATDSKVAYRRKAGLDNPIAASRGFTPKLLK
jgi:hypothetical protein